MVHARNVKPPVAGAKLVSIDESSVRSLPGFVKVVSKGNYVAVVCEREEQAINAARQLKVNWQKPATRAVPVVGRPVQVHAQRDADVERRRRSWSAIPTRRSRARRRSSKPNTTCRSRGTRPSVRRTRLADPSNGQMTIYSNDMKSYGMRNGVAQFLGMPREQVRVVWMEGPQGYGRTAADDAGFEAAYLAKEIGRPVRVQWMRHEETAWDTKGPAFTFKMRGGARRAGQSRRARLRRAGRRLQPPRLQRARHGADRAADGTCGARRRPPAARRTPSDMYAIPNRRMAIAGREPAAGVGDAASHRKPARSQRSAGRRSRPNRSSTRLAAAAKADPVEFRMRLLTASTDRRQRVQAGAFDRVLKAAAEAYGWEPRPSPKPRRHRRHPHRARHRLRLPQPDRRRGDRRSRSESQDRPRVGEAAGVRARLRAGHQPRRRCAARSRAACSTR